MIQEVIPLIDEIVQTCSTKKEKIIHGMFTISLNIVAVYMHNDFKYCGFRNTIYILRYRVVKCKEISQFSTLD